MLNYQINKQTQNKPFYVVNNVFVQACHQYRSASTSYYALQSSSSVITTLSQIFDSSSLCTYNSCSVSLVSSNTLCNTYINLQFDGSTQFTSQNKDCVLSGTYSCQYQVQCNAYNAGAFVGINSNTITIQSKLYSSFQSCYASTFASNPNTFTVNQYSGVSNINSQTAVQVSQYFTIPDNSSSFSSCNLYSGTVTDSSVSVLYSGTGPTATVVFQIHTSSIFATKNLNLGCVVSGTSITVYGSNTIAFTVNPDLTGINPSPNSYTYSFNQNSGSAQEINLPMQNYFSGISATSNLQSCILQDISQTASTRVSVQITGQYFTFTTTTSTAFTVLALYLNCLVSGSTSRYVLNNYPISFTVNPCQYINQNPNPSSFSYNFNQNSGQMQSLNLPITNYFSGLSTECYFQSCSLESGSTTSTQVTAQLTGIQTSQQIFFTTQTSNILNQSLKLKCLSTDQSYVTNNNAIVFTVNQCQFTSIIPNPSSYTFSFYQNSGQEFSSNLPITNYFSGLSTECYFQSCTFEQGSTSSAYVTAILSGTQTLQQIIFQTNTQVPFQQSLQIKCQSTDSQFTTNNHLIMFTVNPCFYSNTTSYPLSYTYFQYQNNGNVVESTLQISDYFNGISSVCYFHSCSFISGSLTSTQVTAVLSGSLSSQDITFSTSTLSAFATQLQIQCSSTDLTIQITKSISFTVKPCIFTSKYPQSYSLQQYNGSGTMYFNGLNISNFIGRSFQTCSLYNCNLIDSLGNHPTYAILNLDLSSQYQLQINTKNLTADLPVGSTKIKVQCNYLPNSVTASNYFNIWIICGPNSVVVSPPSNFQEVTYYKIQSNNIASYKYDNFTSSNPNDCPIVSHKLVLAPTNQIVPSYITIIEGNQQFEIKNISMSNQTFQYSFYVMATAQGGAVIYKKIFIYNFIDCNDDVISLSQNFPDKTESHFKQYVYENNYPVLKTNQSFNSKFKVNLKNRFSNILSKFCPLIDFKIKKVICNSEEEKDFKNYLSINQKGELEVLEQSNTELSNCHVYVAAFNSQMWGYNQKQHLVDISLYQEKSNFISDVLPSFIHQPQSYHVDLAQFNQEFITLQLPNVNSATNQVQIKNSNNVKFLNVLFNKKNLSSSFQIDSNKIKFLKEYEVQLKLFSGDGRYKEYKIKLNISKSKNLIVSAWISSIDQYGVAVVQFSEQMILNKSISWVNYTSQNYLPFNNSWINKSNTVLQILPSFGRQFYEEFEENQIKLNWHVKQVTNRSITFQIIFDYPLQISPLIKQDRLQIKFNGSQYLLVSQKNNKSLDLVYWRLTRNVKKQLPNNSQTQSLNTSGGYMNKLLLSVLILSILLNIIGYGCVEYMLLMFRSLQIVLHLPILQVVFPANALTFFKFIFSLVQFDILNNFPLFDYFTFIDYDNSQEPQIISQMIDIGYEDRNAFSGLKILTLVLLLYFTRVFFSIFTGICGACFSWKNKYINQLHSLMIKGLYFNQIIRISMEAYFEFYLIGYMNFQTLRFSQIGEILGALETFFVLFMILIVLKILSFYIIFKKKNVLEKKGKRRIINFIGEIYESTKINNQYQRAYTFLFLLRRFSFLSIGTFIQDDKYSGIQIISILILNLLWIVFIGNAKAQRSQELNQIERVNELFVQFSTVLITLFTDYVQNEDIQYMYGWLIAASLSLLLTYNLFFIFRNVFQLVKLIFAKIYNQALKLNNNKYFNFQKDQQISIKQIELQQTIRKIVQKQQSINTQKYIDKNRKIDQKQKQFIQNNLQAIPKIQIIDQYGNIILQAEKQLRKENMEETQQKSKKTAQLSQKKNLKKKKQIQNEFKQYSDDLNKKIKKKKLGKQEILTNEKLKIIQSENAKKFVENFRKKRQENQKNLNIKDATQQNFYEFLQKHQNIFESCIKVNNQMIEIIKDLKYLSFVQTDSIIDIRLKEVQISQYVQSLVIAYSNLGDPMAASKEFNQHLYKFTDYLIFEIQYQK